MKYTASLVQLDIDERIESRRAAALERGIPVADDETLNFLLLTLTAFQPTRILEIGTAVGLSSVAMLQACPAARLTTVELEEERYLEAKKNFEEFGVSARVNAHLGDAGEILAMMDGLLFADDVLLYGWVSGAEPTPQKRHSIVDKLRSYLDTVTKDKDFITSVLDIGDGVALSVYKGKAQA